jgi:hypothetical protein
VDHPDGPRIAVCIDGSRAAVAAVGVVDSSGDRARAHAAGFTGPDRASRTDARDAEGGNGHLREASTPPRDPAPGSCGLAAVPAWLGLTVRVSKYPGHSRSGVS